jgi:hypothetical protein
MSDPMAVVDPECRVIGVSGLRVADSSIFPRVTNGNLNAPSIMTGEKASDHILGRQALPREEREPWIDPDWRWRSGPAAARQDGGGVSQSVAKAAEREQIALGSPQPTMTPSARKAT